LYQPVVLLVVMLEEDAGVKANANPPGAIRLASRMRA